MKLKSSKRIWIFVVAFALALSACTVVTGLYIYNKSRMEYAQMEQVVLINANKINNTITKLLYKTQILATLVVQNNGDVQDFERVASVISDDPAVKDVLIAPNGIVSDIYPIEGNEKAIGLNFFKEGDGNEEAIAAKATKQLTLGGPFDLTQGDQALVGRLPIFMEDEEGQEKFWGIVSVTLDYPEALDGAGLDQLQHHGYAYRIWRINPDTNEKQTIAISNYEHNRNARFVEKDINILNADWVFRISPVKKWIEYPETWIFSIVGLLISILVGFFAVNTYNLKSVKEELEILTYTDSLTGALSRRGLMAELEELIKRDNCKFMLSYLDLNKFKSLNDKYGHGVGDKVIQTFAQSVKKYMTKNHVFGRMGGDEFILVFKDSSTEELVQAFFKQIENELDLESVKADINGIHITFSVGIANYPEQCKSIDELIASADMSMYENKESSR